MAEQSPERPLGHDAAIAGFETALQSGRMPHAWLLTGKEGIGKAMLARYLAQQLLAGPEGMRPAPPLASHPDVRMVERRINEKTGKRQAEINVEEIRALNAFLRLTPSLSPWRVAIIDAVDDLNRNAANALLKSLEEPGGRTVIFLVNHARGRLLPTIRSRCRRLALAPLDDETIDRALAADEKVTEADRHLIIDLVQGSLGRALSLTGSGAMETLRMAWDVLRQWPDYDVERLHGVGESVAARGQEERFAQLPLFLAWWWRRYFRRASGIDMPPLLEGEEELARKWAACSLDHWAGKWEKISELFARVESANADRKTVWLTALLSLVP